jgi:hypothetical protein
MAQNENCIPCEDNIFKRLSSNPDISELLGSAGKPHYVEGDGTFIFVNRVETQDDITDTISYSPYTPLVISSFTNDQSLLLKGYTLTDFELDWVYNKLVQTHSLDNGLTAPTVIASLVYNLVVSGQSIAADTAIILTADDDTGDAVPDKTATTNIYFGNNIYYGAVSIPDTGAYAPDDTAIKALTNSPIKRNKNTIGTITYSNSGVDSYMVFTAPTSFSIVNFQASINPLPGGFIQVGSPFSITNNEGFAENYTVWRSTYDNTQGNDGGGNPITFTII